MANCDLARLEDFGSRYASHNDSPERRFSSNCEGFSLEKSDQTAIPNATTPRKNAVPHVFQTDQAIRDEERSNAASNDVQDFCVGETVKLTISLTFQGLLVWDKTLLDLTSGT